MFALSLLSSLSALLPYIITTATAAPSHPPPTRRSVTALTSGQLDALTPYTHFAQVAYCSTDAIQSWTCGGSCNALAGFKPTITGGDGNDVQIYYVGHWPPDNTIIVSHEGTDPSKFLSILTDLDIAKVPLDRALFPGTPSSVLVHEGFRNAHAKTASLILAEVKRLLASTGATSVTCLGHSLGGSIAQLDSLFFTLNLPSSVAIKAITYGTPRVGNPAYAAFFDSKVPNYQRINNARDIIPIMPGRSLGFQHPHGEVHLISDSQAVACSGDDDAVDAQCQDRTVPNIFLGNIFDHLGPYHGFYFGTIYCN